MPQRRPPRSLDDLAKRGDFTELKRRIEEDHVTLDLARLFERAVTDFRTIPRRSGHFEILRWCVDQGLDVRARAGDLQRSIISLAASAGNCEIVAYLTRHGMPADPFVWASLGEVDRLRNHAAEQDLAALHDVNGFNLLFNCAESALGRHDDRLKQRLTDTCRFLLEQGVSPRHEVPGALQISPAFLCAAHGGKVDIMRLLLEHGGLTGDRQHLVVEHALEPHQRSGEPFYEIAGLVVQQGFDLNQLRPGQGRTLLHGASNRGSKKAVIWLLAKGANPNSLDDHGRTPLHVCAIRNTAATVAKLLVEAGTNPSARDLAGKTARDYAVENRRSKVVEYLDGLP